MQSDEFVGHAFIPVLDALTAEFGISSKQILDDQIFDLEESIFVLLDCHMPNKASKHGHGHDVRRRPPERFLSFPVGLLLFCSVAAFAPCLFLSHQTPPNDQDEDWSGPHPSSATHGVSRGPFNAVYR